MKHLVLAGGDMHTSRFCADSVPGPILVTG